MVWGKGTQKEPWNKGLIKETDERVKKSTEKTAETNRKNKTGFAHNKKLQIKGGKIGGKITKQKYGLKHYSKLGILGSITNKKNGTGMCHNKEIQTKAGLAAQKILRHNIRNLYFKGNYYDSMDEIFVSLSLQEQYNYKPIEGENLHIQIGIYEYDYLLKYLKLFIEKHSFWKNYETYEEYFKRKRFNLDKNGYKDYNLVVIK